MPRPSLSRKYEVDLAGDNSPQRTWITSEEKKQLILIAHSETNAENIMEHMELLSSLYDKAVAYKDVRLVQVCQLLASKCILAVMQKDVPVEARLRSLAEKLCIHLPLKMDPLFDNNGSLSAAPKKNIDLIDDVLGGQHQLSCTESSLKISEHEIPLSGGIKHLKLEIETPYEHETLGEMMVVEPRNNEVYAAYVAESPAHEPAAQKGRLLFCAANFSFSPKFPATATIAAGKSVNLYVDSTMRGIVLLENGSPKILDSRENDIHVLMDRTISSGGTLFQCNLLVKDGMNIVPVQGSSSETSMRRLLVTFNDGSYGIVQIDKCVDLYDAGHVLAKIPGIKNAVNFDAGGSKERTLIGHVGSATMFYVGVK